MHNGFYYNIEDRLRDLRDFEMDIAADDVIEDIWDRMENRLMLLLKHRR